MRREALNDEQRQRRLDAMIAMYHHPLHPKSLHEVGQAFGLTRERVRQLFFLAGVPRRGRAETKHIKYQAHLRTQRHGVE